jgi:tRNA (guanine10-N2)-dimethyltransferase
LTGSIFVLSGEDLTLPFAEICSLVETYSPKSRVEKLGQRLVISNLSDEDLINRISDRAAYCRFGGALVSRGNKIQDLVDDRISVFDASKSYAVASEILDRKSCGDLGALIKARTNAKVSLENPDVLFHVESGDGELVLGMTTQGRKKFNWRERRPRARKFFLPSAIYPKFARVLVNLSRVREGELFLDPFCGTGSLLIESAVLGMRSIGIDLTRWIARGALKNLKGFSLDFEAILRADSTSKSFPIRSVDGIATDVPYGRASSTKGKDTERIIGEFLQGAADILSSESSRSKYCVVMHPSHVELRFDHKSFELTERHFVYVHRNLTRAISVLRRSL